MKFKPIRGGKEDEWIAGDTRFWWKLWRQECRNFRFFSVHQAAPTNDSKLHWCFHPFVKLSTSKPLSNESQTNSKDLDSIKGWKLSRSQLHPLNGPSSLSIPRSVNSQALFTTCSSRNYSEPDNWRRARRNYLSVGEGELDSRRDMENL